MFNKCEKCNVVGIRLYKSAFTGMVNCYECLIKRGGEHGDKNTIVITIGTHYKTTYDYHPFNGRCQIITEQEMVEWQSQPIYVADLYQLDSQKFKESEETFNRLQK